MENLTSPYQSEFLKSAYFKPIAQYVVNDYISNMMSNDSQNLYYHYINEAIYYLNQINTYQLKLLWIEQNNMFLNLDGEIIKNDLNNLEAIEQKLSTHFRIQINIIKNVEELVLKKELTPI